MRRAAAILLVLAMPAQTAAQDHEAIADRAVAVILPAAGTFAAATAALADAAPGAYAAMQGEAVQARFHAAWDAWMALQPFASARWRRSNAGSRSPSGPTRGA